MIIISFAVVESYLFGVKGKNKQVNIKIYVEYICE